MSPEVELTLFEIFALISFLIGYAFHAWVKIEHLGYSELYSDWKNTVSFFFLFLSLCLFFSGFVYYGYKNKSFNDVSGFMDYSGKFFEY